MESRSPRIRAALGLTSFGVTSAVAISGAFGQTVLASNDKNVETVNVTARKPSLDKLPEKILDTPQSINVVPLNVIQEQGTTSLQDALKNVPGITLNAGEGGAHGDTVNLRGFSASDDFFLDGLRDTGFYTRDSFNYQALEVYKGPASTLFGRGSTGGVINQVSKTPQLYPILDGTATIGSNEEYRETADINETFGASDALRINAMDETSHVEDRDFVRNKRLGVAPSIAFGIDTPTTLTLSLYHEEENNIPDFGIPFLFGKPAPVPRDTFYGLAAGDSWKTNVSIATATLNHDFGDDLSVVDKARYGFYRFDGRMTAPHYGDNDAGGDGEPPPPVPGQALDTIEVLRDRPSASGDVTTLMNETDATYKFLTGPFAHTLVMGVELDQEESDLVRFANQIDQIAPVPLTDPDPREAFPGRQTKVKQRPDTKADTVGAYLVDTITLAPAWSIVAALRDDRFAANYDEPITDSHFDHTDWIATPRAALIYKPEENQSYYFSYGTSYDPSAENLSLSTRNADLGPEKDRTFELGAKQQWLGGMLSATAALFDTEMTNARIADPTNPSLQALSGDLHERGFEAGAAGSLTTHWELLAGYTYLDGSSQGVFGTNVKGPIPNTAHNQANLWTTYDFDSGWKIGAGANYLGRRAAFKDPAGMVAEVPGYLTWDAMTSYQLTDNIQLQLNGYNLLDKYYFTNSYYTSDAENHVIPGAGRTITFTVAVNY